MKKIRIRISQKIGHPAALMTALLWSIAPAARIANASPGTEAASFLDIPVGGRPAALGASYSALAADAYAPVWNPAGLGALDSTQVAGMHLSYLESINYEFASFAHPLASGKGLGMAAQYFSPGNVHGTDPSGNALGDFSGHFAAYSVGYGQALGDRLRLGAVGKIIDAKISDVTAHAYAADIGALFDVSSRLRLAVVAANLGSKLTFLSQKDSLPSAARLGAAYRPWSAILLSVEGVRSFSGLNSAHSGVEWTPAKPITLRAGFRSDTLKNLPGFSGFTTGVGLHFWGQEFDYAWVPLGDLGNTQYFSLVLRLGAPAENPKNLQRLAL